MSAADNLRRTQFGSLIFPSEVTRLVMPGRHYVHEYAHAPGGSPEKLGRGLVKLTTRARFHDRFPGYPNLYPVGMQTLFTYAQQQSTQQFTHPSAGVFPAFIINWDQKKEAKLRSGEDVDIDFLEDQESSFALAAVVTPTGKSQLGPTQAQLEQDWDSVATSLGVTQGDQNVFDALTNAVTTVLAFQDTTQLYGNRYAASITNMVSLCQQVSNLTIMQDIRAWPVINTLYDLWGQGVTISKDLQSQQVSVQTFTVPYTESAVDIAITLYGDASRHGDILSLNSDVISDPLHIRAGTSIRYYPAS